jgi:hypothetical protein
MTKSLQRRERPKSVKGGCEQSQQRKGRTFGYDPFIVMSS